MQLTAVLLHPETRKPLTTSDTRFFRSHPNPDSLKEAPPAAPVQDAPQVGRQGPAGTSEWGRRPSYMCMLILTGRLSLTCCLLQLEAPPGDTPAVPPPEVVAIDVPVVVVSTPGELSGTGPDFHVVSDIHVSNMTLFRHLFANDFICLSLDNAPSSCWPLSQSEHHPLFVGVPDGLHTLIASITHPIEGHVIPVRRPPHTPSPAAGSRVAHSLPPAWCCSGDEEQAAHVLQPGERGVECQCAGPAPEGQPGALRHAGHRPNGNDHHHHQQRAGVFTAPTTATSRG